MQPNHPPSSVYQIAGLDDRERGFNRQAPVVVSPEGVQLDLQYETFHVVIGPVPTEEQALRELMQELQRCGYSQLRHQRLFAGDRYLGSQEVWVDYPDPPPPQEQPYFWKWLIRWIRGRSGTAGS
ncbi:MAG: hypothetical protein AB7P17_01705 [Nitrospirales bacterium]|nr:hypothetical protein [Nitrospirales bacterium]